MVYRIILGPSEVAGLLNSMESGLRENGAKAHFIDLGKDPFLYSRERKASPFVHYFLRSRARFFQTRDASIFNPLRYFITLNLLLSQSLMIGFIAFWADAILLKSGESFTGHPLELILYKILRCKLIFLFVGSDSRPPYLLGYWAEVIHKVMSGASPSDIKADVYTIAMLLERTKKIRRNVDERCRWADHVIVNPLSAHFHSGPCIVVQCLGAFVDNNRLEYLKNSTYTPRNNRRIRIFHGPSLAEVKGSSVFREVVERLRLKGYPIDYVELSGVPNTEILNEIAQSDIVLDELYSDTFGGSFAMEGAMLGKPVVTGGYGLDELTRFVSKEYSAPVNYCHPKDVEAEIERLVADKDYRLDCGRRLNEYYLKHANSKSAARKLIQIVSGDVPQTWLFDPRDVRYVGGFGGEEGLVRRCIRYILDSGGPSALCIDDKPLTRDALIRFAGGNE